MDQALRYSCNSGVRRAIGLLIISITASSSVGCALAHRHDHALDQQGQVIYLDGAGGGSLLTDWGRGVQSGLKAAGYMGAFENHSWQTGLGVLADQDSSVEYKKARAKEVADEISKYIRGHPDAPVNLVGLSAGTAIAVYALEQLPKELMVENVILLGSSLSRHYNLSEALRHVKNRIYVLTSENDAVLAFAVSAAGTADRQFCGACSAGLHGFHMPADLSPEQARLYAKLENIAWRKEFAGAGNLGGHTDATNERFVKAYLAPLLLDNQPRFTFTAQPPVEREPASVQ